MDRHTAAGALTLDENVTATAAAAFGAKHLAHMVVCKMRYEACFHCWQN